MEDDKKIVRDLTKSSVKTKVYFDKFEGKKTRGHAKYKTSLQ